MVQYFFSIRLIYINLYTVIVFLILLQKLPCLLCDELSPRVLPGSTVSFSSKFFFFCDRIRLYKSGSRGSILKKVAKNMPDATQLLHKFKGGTSKRVYLILKNDDENGGTDI